MEYKNTLIIFMLVIINVQLGLSQNLIPNPSFEEYTAKPKFPNRSSKLLFKDWISQNGGTPDFFDKTVKNRIVSAKNYMGYCEPNSGNNFVGLIIYDNTEFSGYKESLQVKLNKPLEKGFSYCFSMYVALAEKADFSTNDIGIFFSKDKIKGSLYDLSNSQKDIRRHWYFETPYKQLKPNLVTNTYIESNEWVFIQDTIVSNGDEQYITIGSFIKEPSVKRTKDYKGKATNPNKNLAYYYLDDVSLTPVSIADDCPCKNITHAIYNLNDTINSELSESSKDSVNRSLRKNIENELVTNKDNLIENSVENEIIEAETFLNFIEFGYEFNETNGLVLNFARGKRFMFGGGLESIFHENFMFNSKLFYRLPIGGYYLFSDLNIMYLTNFEHGSFGVRPEINLLFGPFKLGYGYNYLFSNQDKLPIGNHNFSVLVYLEFPSTKTKK